MSKKLTTFLTSATLLLLPLIASAQGIDVGGIIGRLTGTLIVVADGVIVIMFIFAGFMYLTARGEPGKVQLANKTVIWAIVGVAVIVLAQATNQIYNLVTYLLYGP